MGVVSAVERMGGMATRAALIRATSRADVDQALRHQTVVRAGQGRYTLPALDAAAALAFRMNGHLSLTSAALHHGWEVKGVPEKPHVVFPKIATSHAPGVTRWCCTGQISDPTTSRVWRRVAR